MSCLTDILPGRFSKESWIQLKSRLQRTLNRPGRFRVFPKSLECLGGRSKSDSGCGVDGGYGLDHRLEGGDTRDLLNSRPELSSSYAVKEVVKELTRAAVRFAAGDPDLMAKI